MTFVDGVLGAAIMLAPVLVFAALGGVVHQRSGVVDIALEGFILIGSFVGIIAANAAASGTLGLGAGMLAGAVVGWLFSFIVSRLGANMIIVGLGVNTVLFGLTGLILAERYGSRSAFRPDADIDLPSFGLGFLADVPVLGPLLASNDVVVWAMVPAVVAVSWALLRTRWGLRIRAAGGDAGAATAVGISVPRVRLGAGDDRRRPRRARRRPPVDRRRRAVLAGHQRRARLHRPRRGVLRPRPAGADVPRRGDLRRLRRHPGPPQAAPPEHPRAARSRRCRTSPSSSP